MKIADRLKSKEMGNVYHANTHAKENWSGYIGIRPSDQVDFKIRNTARNKEE